MMDALIEQFFNIGVMVIMMALDFGHDQILPSQLSNTSIRRPSRGEPE